MAKERKKPAKIAQHLFQAHSPGLRQLSKDTQSELRAQARAEWHRNNPKTK
jgi:hypothetical protein